MNATFFPLFIVIYYFFTSPETDKECRSVVDIAFIIDSSESIGRRNWVLVKRFVKSIVSKLDVSSSATRIAAVAYSTNPEVVMLFRNFQGTDMVNRVFDSMRWQRGFTYTDKALQLADRAVFQTSSGMRENVPKVSSLIAIFRHWQTSIYAAYSVSDLTIVQSFFKKDVIRGATHQLLLLLLSF